MAKNRLEEKEGIVLRLTPQKEADAMVSCIDAGGFFSFYAYGVRKMNSKNASAVQELAYSRFLLDVSSQEALRLKEAQGIEILRADSDFSSIAVASAIQEFCLKALPEDDAPSLYEAVKASLRCLKQGKEPLSILATFLGISLRKTGYGLEVDGCVSCGKRQNIVSLDLDSGGFLCLDCFDEMKHEKTGPQALRIYRYLFRCRESDIGRVDLPLENLEAILKKLNDHLESSISLRLKSVDSLLKYR